MWAELKSDEHLRRSPTKQRHLMPFHLPSAILNHDLDIFIAGTAPSFSIKRCANPASNWALFIQRLSTKHLRNSVAAPEKQTISTVHVTLDSSGS